MFHLINRLRESARREWLWWRHERWLKRQVRAHPLDMLFYEVTRRCNLECAYCGSDCTVDKRANELSSQEWIEITRQIAKDFDARKVFVAVIGGEPLIKDGILDIFRELRRHKFPWGIVSNGFMISKQMAEDLVSAGMMSISLSMDAPPELNDRIRGRGASENVVSAVKNLKDARFYGKLEIMSTVTAPTVPHLAGLRNFIAGLGVPLWRLSLVMPIGRAAHRPDLIPDSRDVRAILEYIRLARMDLISPKPEFCEECFVGNRFEGMVRPYLAQCLSGICVGGIQADGRIGACPELGTAFTQGDIRRERFKDVWDNKYQIFRDRSWTKKDDCAVCDHYYHCKGSGLHLYDSPDSKLMRCLYKMAKEAEEDTKQEA